MKDKPRSPAEELAEAIHESTCRFAHEDQCGWFYESWEKPGWSRKRYTDRAEKLLKTPIPDSWAAIIEITRSYV